MLKVAYDSQTAGTTKTTQSAPVLWSRAPLSFQQEALWYRDQSQPNHPALKVATAYRLKGKLDLDLLQKSVVDIFERHELLRTSYLDRDHSSRVVECIHPGLAAEIKIIDATHLSSGEEVVRVISEEAGKAFDPAQPPLIRFTLFDIREDEHVLLIAGHSIILDDTSLQILFSELGQLYTRDSLKTAKGQNTYLDFALSQRSRITPSMLDSQLEFWKTKLTGIPLSLPLRPDRIAKAPLASSAQCREIMFTEGLEKKIAFSCEQNGVNRQVMLLSALQVLFFHHRAGEPLLIPIVFDGREGTNFESAIGPFNSATFLRSDSGGNLPVYSLLKKTTNQVQEMVARNDVPAVKVLEIAKPETAKKPVGYPFAVRLSGLAPQPVEFAGLIANPVQLNTWLDLQFDFHVSDGKISGSVLYREAIFDRQTVERMIAHFENLLTAALDNPALPISQLPLLSKEERQQVLIEWNRTERAYAREKCVHNLFEEQAERYPERVAAVFGSEQLTYGELNHRANQLAQYLQARGVSASALVGICVERGLEMLVAMIGVLKAGGAYVPLDPAYPAERIAFMLEDSGMTVLITQSEVVSRLSQRPARVVEIDKEWMMIAQYTGKKISGSTTPADLAYVRYTSGSTGKPKGVMVPHGAVVNFMESMAREPAMSAKDTLVAVTTLSFDISELELWLPLSVGAKVVIADRATAADGVRLGELLRTAGATVMQATPASWRMLLDSGWSGDSKLRILCGGEALPKPLAEALLPRCGELWNMYGPTETTIWSGAHRVRAGRIITLGRPIANTQFYILDKHQQPVPVGVAGELHIAGEGLARGYWKREDLTAEKFIANPFSEDSTARMYKTGDLCCWLPDGNLEYHGRTDHQVKVRGFRIELGEIEYLLVSHPAVREAVVLAREDTPGMKKLVAYVVTSKTEIVALRQMLKARLPEYMVPAVFMPLSYLPRTPNGKIDRNALPVPDQQRPELDKPYLAPRSDVEKKLAEIWEQVLGIKPIGINDNYFDLGADSLTTAQLFAKVQKKFGSTISPVSLFSAPTIEQLSHLVSNPDAKQRKSEWSCLVPVRTEGSRPPVFCIHGGAGTVLFFQNLSKYLEDRPIYALQSLGLYGGAVGHRTVEAMATHYLAEIRSVQPHGPYYLVGYCFGILVALELAQMLRAAGETIALLGSINGTIPAYANGPAARRFKKPSGIPSRIRHGVAWRYEMLRRMYYEARRRYYLSRNLSVPAALRDSFFLLINKDAEFAYHPRPYPGQLSIFRARGLYKDSDLGWKQFITGLVEIYEIPGKHLSHRTILEEPIVRDLAVQLKHCLNTADERFASHPLSKAERAA